MLSIGTQKFMAPLLKSLNLCAEIILHKQCKFEIQNLKPPSPGQGI